MTTVRMMGYGIKEAKFEYKVCGRMVNHSFRYVRAAHGEFDEFSRRRSSSVAREFIRHKLEISKSIARM